MTRNEIQEVFQHVECFGLKFRFSGSLFMQVAQRVRDVETDEWKEYRGRKWYISSHMCKSELVQTAFKAVMTFYEHEIRENFTYKGKRVFGPHFDVEELVAIADKTETREET